VVGDSSKDGEKFDFNDICIRTSYRLYNLSIMINAKMVNPNYYYPNEFEEKGNIFFENYGLVKEFGPSEEKISGLKPKNSRICRFCSRKYPLVSFNMDAHIIPEMLGRNKMISDFECDECNTKFGKYENDFANFLGISRTANFIKGKEKIPKFKSANKNLVAETLDDPEDGNIISIKRFDGLDKTFEFDKENRQTIITYTKGPYTPLKIYKYFVKLGLSMLPESDLHYYEFAMKYIRSEKHDKEVTGFAMMQGYQMPLTFQYRNPAFFLFKKKDIRKSLFNHVFYLSTLNHIFQIVLPFNINDRPFYTNSIKTYWCPPLFGDDKKFETGFVSKFSMDLNVSDRQYGKTEQLIIPTPEGEYDKSKILNKITGEITERPFDPSQIIGIDIQRIEVDE